MCSPRLSRGNATCRLSAYALQMQGSAACAGIGNTSCTSIAAEPAFCATCKMFITRSAQSLRRSSYPNRKHGLPRTRKWCSQS
eukprot:8320600-Pyramimonas_sp.AAC.1